MSVRRFQVRTRPPSPPAEGAVTLVSADRGVRWVARARIEGNLGEPVASEFLATRAGTELIWLGETEAEALDRAEVWMRERYEVIEGKPGEGGPPEGGRKRGAR